MSEQQRPAGWGDEARVRQWIAGAEQREAQMVPVNEELFAAAALQPGETVLDIGCGTGPTTRQAAALVGPAGRTVGTDLSPAMIEAAARLAAELAEAAPASSQPTSSQPTSSQPGWLAADAETYDFGTGQYDVVISRFGVMFFPDPCAAFANLLRATRPGGRLVAAIWRTREHVPLFAIPYDTATEVLDELGVSYEPVPIDDNQCSLGTHESVTAVLAPAGWCDIETRPSDGYLYIGGELTPAQAAESALDIGPIRGVLDGRSEQIRQAVRVRLQTTFERWYDGTGILVPAGFMILTARRSAD